MAKDTKPKQILVIDGGGMRGLAPLMIVDAIMKEITTKSGRVLRPYQVFDLIGGTSVGGLISILLGRLGLDCQTAIDIYKTIVKKLFREQQNAWNVIQRGEFLNTSEFDEYIVLKVAEFTGSPNAMMNPAPADGQDRDRPSTRTFVALMEEAPSYTHMISSYTRERVSASAARGWTIADVMKVAIASPIYLSPLNFETDTMRRFQDAGFGGYNNPVALASGARKGIWFKEPIGTVISLGTGLQGYLPNPVPTTRVWGPNPSYVSKLCDQVFRERLPGVHRYGSDCVLNVTHAVRELARMAADSSFHHAQFYENRASFCEHYHRIDEPFGLGPFDLIDIYHEETIKVQIDTLLQKGVIKQIVEDLGIESRLDT